MTRQNKIPVYILSGFLGSGKTTVMLNLLEHCQKSGMQPAIILNEIGQVNVESHLFDDQQVIELLNGCICCTIQDDLKQTMDELTIEMNKSPIDVLLIEGTGVANPLEVQETLLNSPYHERFEIMSIITVLDASHYLEYQSKFSSSQEVRTLMKEQLICGSLLLLNKTDLVPSEKIEKIKQKIATIANEEKEIVECTYGQLDADFILEKRIRSISMNPSCSDGEHRHHDHSAVQAITLEDFPPLQEKIIKKWLRNLPPSVLRGKGYVKLAGAKHLHSFQYASGKISFTPLPANVYRKPIILLIGMGIGEEQMHHYYQQLLK